MGWLRGERAERRKGPALVRDRRGPDRRAGHCRGSVVAVASAQGCRRQPARRADRVVRRGLGEGTGLFVAGDRGRLTFDHIELVNRGKGAATITDVRLVPGGGSEHLPFVERMVIAGDKEPVVGYEVQGRDVDTGQIGKVLIMRLGMEELQNASFRGVEVLYTWHGDKYKAYFNQAIAMCRVETESSRRPKECRGHTPREPAYWPTKDPWAEPIE